MYNWYRLQNAGRLTFLVGLIGSCRLDSAENSGDVVVIVAANTNARNENAEKS